MMSLISAARMSMASFLYLLRELVGEVMELGAQRAVVDDIADLGEHAAEERRVLAALEIDLLAARELLERGGDLLELIAVERLGRNDLGRHAVRARLDHRIELARDRGHRCEALAVEEQRDEVLRHLLR